MPSLELVPAPAAEPQQSAPALASAKPQITPASGKHEAQTKKKKSSQMTLGAFFTAKSAASATPLAPAGTKPKTKQKTPPEAPDSVEQHRKSQLRDIVLGRGAKKSTAKKLDYAGDAEEAPAIAVIENKRKVSKESNEVKKDAMVANENEADEDTAMLLVDDSPVDADDAEPAAEITSSETLTVDDDDDNTATEAVASDTAMGVESQETFKEDTVDAAAEDAPAMPLARKEEVVDLNGINDKAVVEAMEKVPTTSQPHRSRAASMTEGRAEPSANVLPAETQELLQKHATMRKQYCQRANEILAVCRHVVDEEDFEIPVPESETVPPEASFDNFPDFAVKTLVCLVEGSAESLSILALRAVERLNEVYATERFTLESTTAKLKLLATRKNNIKNPWMASGMDLTDKQTLDLFEDDNMDHMWRWEVTLLDLLPESVVPKVKKARSARKKLSSHFAAIAKLLSSLNDADKLLVADGSSKARVDKLLAKISQDEEKALKFQREQERARLAAEAKRKKEATKNVQAKKRKTLSEDEKQAAQLEKQKDKERKKEEAAEERQKKKEAAARERAEAKRQKQLEKVEKEQKEKAVQQAKIQKQSAFLMSFLAAKPAAEKKTPKDVVMPVETAVKVDEPARVSPVAGFDIDAFRAGIGSESGDAKAAFLASVSSGSQKGRKRRTRRVPVSVCVTVQPDDPFDQPYVEPRDVLVLNKYKFLRFHEDVRPPYFGTWSKKSAFVTGRKPIGKDESTMDYDFDSEAEWEEGDDDMGEDVENENDVGDDEEEDEEDDNEDGWLAADDEIDDELDDETRQLRLQQRAAVQAARERSELQLRFVCLVDGVSFSTDLTLSKKNLEGWATDEAGALLSSHSAVLLNSADVFLDAFPPALVDEPEPSGESVSPSGDKTGGKDMSDDDMRTFVRFVHQCTLGSKEKVVDEFRSAHESIVTSRAHTHRVLDLVADKKKHPINGVYWEAKKEILEKLGLDELVMTVGSETEDTREAKKTIAKFIHNSTCKSKEKLVDELMHEHESLTSSKAEAARVLDAIAEKKKHPEGGVYWKIKEDVRDELGLDCLSSSPPVVSKDGVGSASPQASAEQQPTQSAKSSTKSKASLTIVDGKVDNKAQTKAQVMVKKRTAPASVLETVGKPEDVANKPEEAISPSKKRKSTEDNTKPHEQASKKTKALAASAKLMSAFLLRNK